MFGSSTAAPNVPSSQTQPPQDNLGKSQNREPAHFSSLLERQKKKARLSTIEQNGRLNSLPSVNMDLGDLARKAQELGSRSGGANQSTIDSRAHYLLAGSGVSPGKAYKDFQALDSEAPGFDRLATSSLVDDRDTYLRSLQTKGREAMMRESMERVYRDIDTYIEQSLGIDFQEQQQRIMEHFGLIPRSDKTGAETPSKASFARTRSVRKPAESTSRSVFGRSALEKSMIGAAGANAGTTSFFGGDNGAAPTALHKLQTMRDLRDKERLFVEKVQQLNQIRLQEKPFPIMQHFQQVEHAAGGDSPKQLSDAYIALQEITDENNAENHLKERQYAPAYLNENSNAQDSIKLRKQILEKSRTYLEKAFYRELESMVEKNPREAQLGGRPTVLNKIRAYVRVRAARHDLAPDGAELQQIGDNGDYCWILIFYLLRSGFVKEAAEYVNNDPAFQSTDRRFVSYLTSYANSPERRLSRKLQEMIDGEYQQRAKIAPKNTVDPYRLACYKVIGRCDLALRNLDTIGQGVEDWIWLQFVLAREVDRLEELSGEIFGLEQICETVTEIGQKHFQKGQMEGGNAYGTFFIMQILAGLFEQAVEYLHAFNPVSAVHFAIALDYYGLLRVSDFNVAGNELCECNPSADQRLLTTTVTFSTTQQPQINFVPLVAYYTTSFRAALPVPATDYLALLCLNADLKPAALGQSQANACHETLRELCLETREFAALLGDIHSDGTRIPGAIEQRAAIISLDSHEDYLKSITSQAAAVADQRGQIADAVLLYHLCEDYDNVITVLNRALADAVSLDLGDAPISLQPLKPREQPSTPNDPNGAQSSLSLTQSTSSPIELAKNMTALYNTNAAYYNKISVNNRETCGVLLQLLSVRAKLESQPPQFMPALEELNQIGVLPLAARGQIPLIRQAAQAFSTLPQILARAIGITILWAVRAIGGEREILARQGSWDTGYGKDSDAVKEQLSNMAKDLMVFSGLVRYKLPGRVYDLLTRAGGDIGGY